MAEFNLSKKIEELSEYLRELGLSNNICRNILMVVINQDKEFIKIILEIVSSNMYIEKKLRMIRETVGDKLITKS